MVHKRMAGILRATDKTKNISAGALVHVAKKKSNNLELGMKNTISEKHGFTLIELLVVIAIISLLVSILLPSLSKAKELAKSAVCMTNLKACGTGFAMYMQDDEQGPFIGYYYGPWMNGSTSEYVYWPDPLIDYGYIEETKTFVCPGNIPDDFVQKPAVPYQPRECYGFNWDIDVDVQTNNYFDMDFNAIGNPSEHILLADSTCGNNASFTSSWTQASMIRKNLGAPIGDIFGIVHMRHPGDIANMLLCDFSVTSTSDLLPYTDGVWPLYAYNENRELVGFVP